MPTAAELQTTYQTLLANSIRPGTSSIYAGIVRRYIEFCATQQIRALPPTTNSVALWMANLASTCVAPTVNNYFAALGHFCRSRGIPWDHIRADHRVVGALKGLRYLKPGATTQKTPLTVPQMKELLGKLNMEKQDDIVFYTATVVGFFGMFRLGELCHHVDERRAIRRKHIVHQESGTYVFLPGSKTDQTFRGAWVLLPKLPDELCPSTALRYLESKIENQETPLFTLQSGSQMSKAWYLRKLQSLLPLACGITGHSLRVGGATWAAQMGFSHDEIKLLGRWSSEAFRVYLKGQPTDHHGQVVYTPRSLSPPFATGLSSF
jgi:integrase